MARYHIPETEALGLPYGDEEESGIRDGHRSGRQKEAIDEEEKRYLVSRSPTPQPDNPGCQGTELNRTIAYCSACATCCQAFCLIFAFQVHSSSFSPVFFQH